MANKKPTVIYRKFLRNAWKQTWQKKSLWVFGIFAALLQGGGIFDAMLKAIRQVEATGSAYESMREGSAFGIAIFGAYIQQIAILDHTRVLITITSIILIGIILVSASVLSQHALIKGLSSPSKHPKRLRRHAWQGFFDILCINILTKIGFLISSLLTGLTFILFLNASTWIHLVLFYLVFLIFIPLTVIIAAIGILATIDVVKKKTHALQAIEHSITMFKTHWLAALELGMSLFLIFFAAIVAVGIALFFTLLIPWFIALFALFSGWVGVFLSFNLVAVGLIATTIFFFVGIATTFHYAAWIDFYKRSTHKQHGTQAFAKLIRFFHR